MEYKKIQALENFPQPVQAKIESFGKVEEIEKVQELWSGYGKILRLKCVKGPNIILKHVRSPDAQKHPIGWNSKFSHDRKLKSYHVESAWYSNYNYQDDSCRIPKSLFNYQSDDCFFILMEDLNDSGFSKRLSDPSYEQIKVCLSWLAKFHAKHLNRSPEGLWEVGSYWHLATRPEELKNLPPGRLKLMASLIDKKLSNASFKTLVHGDAKLENFCFSKDLKNCAMVDFQYVGSDCAMKDVAYFMSSCMTSDECFRLEKEVLSFYFASLKEALQEDTTEIEREWRALYPFAWADFYRFLKGWSPDHWKIHEYSELQTLKAQRSILEELSTIAVNAAKKAGKKIESYSVAERKAKNKKGPSKASSVITDADLAAEDIIKKELSDTIKSYDFGLLTEEAKDDQSRFFKDYFWCVDPLDGTLNYSEGKEGYAVSIALVSQSGAPLIGVAYDPKNGDLFIANLEEGASLNGNLLKINSNQMPFTLFADRSLKDAPNFKDLSSRFEMIFRGGAVMNALSCLSAPPAFYLKYPKDSKGGGSIWDFAATSLIVKEAGGVATDIYGSELDLNRPDSTYMNHRGVFFSSSIFRPDIS